MPQTEVHCNSSNTEEECRRRLVTCYALLFELAQKRRCRASSDALARGPVDPDCMTEAKPPENFAASPSQELCRGVDG